MERRTSTFRYWWMFNGAGSALYLLLLQRRSGVTGKLPQTGGEGNKMLDKLISIRETLMPPGADVFAVINTTMDIDTAVNLLLSVFDKARCEALSKALVAEIKRRRALEIKRPERLNAVRRKVTKHAD